MSIRKSHYDILGLTPSATLPQIEHAFHRLSNLNHPDKNPDDRITAQRQFNQICEAFYTLSNPSIRSNYDELLQKPSLDTALSLLLKFFEQHGFQNQFEKDNFNKLYPDREPTYYEILGISVNSNPLEIERAFRKLSLLYHPKNNLGDALAEKKFINVCAAYNQLYDKFRRDFYDDYMFGEMNSTSSLNHFANYFQQNKFDNEEDTKFFESLLRVKSKDYTRVRSPSEVHDYYEETKNNQEQEVQTGKE